jgi:hypothetical protein
MAFFAPFRILQGRGQILLLTEGLSRFGKASKD